MKKRIVSALWFSALLLTALGADARAQSELSRIEVGGFLSAIKMNESTGEGPAGFGGRASYNLTDHVALDADISSYPQNPSGNFGQTLLSAGIKAGSRFDRLGVFAKARPGVIHFGGDAFKATQNGSKNYFSLDVGGVLEYYANSRVLVRLDISDNIINFGDDLFQRGFPTPTRPRVSHNTQITFGVSVRF